MPTDTGSQHAPTERFVQVAVFCPLANTFTYLWPRTLEEPVKGVRVLLPFGRGRRVGVVLEVLSGAPPDGVEVKKVLDQWDMCSLYSEARIRWVERAARYYLAAPGEMFEAAFSWTRGEDLQRWHCPDVPALQSLDSDLFDLFSKRSTLSVRALAKHMGHALLRHRLHHASAAGHIHLVSGSEEKNLPDSFITEDVPEHLFPAQSLALNKVIGSVGFSAFLLFGPTASGKTEVYLRVAMDKIRAGGQVLVLVPEIGLTPQWLLRLKARLPEVAVWHSGLSDRQRNHVRSRLKDIKVLVGTRSALFLPLPCLSLIVVDEEHDTSFKQGEGVKYSARDMAILLAQELDIPVILGSATPSLETWRQVKTGSYELLTLPERVSAFPPVETEIVDMRDTTAPISDILTEALRQTMERGEQALLYLNRRGYAPALICTACGHVPECPSCSLHLTLHRKRRQLRCHACGFIGAVPPVCVPCGEDSLLPLGEGTEKVEEQLLACFPDLRFTRLDRDAVRSEKKLIGVLERFSSGSLDCLVGTQMLIKGHHFPNVTLVGVINADLGLFLPDFRAGERWWQQLTQVLGRTGRGSKQGRVIVQSRNPDSPWLRRVGAAYSESFLNEELDLRKQLSYPPYERWVRLLFSAKEAVRAENAARIAAEAIAKSLPVRLVGPVPSPLERLAGRYRFEVVLRDADRKVLPWKLAPLLKTLRIPSGVRRKVDVDPMDMM